MILVRAYYTPGAYEREVQPLHESLERFKLYYRTDRIHGLEGWKAAVLHKPRFILECLRGSSAEAIFYTDADSEFRQKPDWAIFKDADLSWHEFKRGPLHSVEHLVGSMWFRNTPEVHAFVEDWVAETEKPMYTDRFTPEQDSLRTVWEGKGWIQRLRFLALPPGWCLFDDCKDVYGEIPPVVWHRQASRKHRHAKKAEAQDPPPAPAALGDGLGDADRPAATASPTGDGDPGQVGPEHAGGLLPDGGRELGGVQLT